VGPVLCLITDRRRWGANWEQPLVEQVRAAARAGLDLVQVREPDLDGRPLTHLVMACLAAVRGTRVRVLVNERIDVALVAGAHGVHLRSTGVPTLRAREMCPRPLMLGRSVHSDDDVQRAAEGADYVLFGTVFPTLSKPGQGAAGLDALSRCVRATAVPVLAVGGVVPERLAEVVATGASGVAAIGAFAEPARAVRRFQGSLVN
jgi:thiamine-phosphate pyrophosphorylase